VLLLSFLLFPITQFYFSPYLIIDGTLRGIVTASFLVFLLFLFGGLFLGRAFCGWVMPCGAFQELCSRVQDKPVSGKLSKTKWFIWVPWILTIAVFAVLGGGYRRIDVFYKLEGGVSVQEVWMYGIYYGVVAILLVLSLAVGRRASCHVLCWMAPFMITGRKLGGLLRLPQLRLVADKALCISCGTCTKVCPMSLEVQHMVDSGRIEHSECILCGKCADECPKQVLALRFRLPSRV
jgi:polyferredoxin